MASFIRDSIIGQCLRPILNYPSWLQYADNAIPIPELNHENQGYENEKPILVWCGPLQLSWDTKQKAETRNS